MYICDHYGQVDKLKEVIQCKTQEREEEEEYLKYSGKYGLIKYSHKAESSFLPKIQQGMPLDTGLKLRGHARSVSRDKTLLVFLLIRYIGWSCLNQGATNLK